MAGEVGDEIGVESIPGLQRLERRKDLDGLLRST